MLCPEGCLSRDGFGGTVHGMPPVDSALQASAPRRVMLLGATGTIGRATAAALVARGYQVVCFVRGGSSENKALPEDATMRIGDVTDPISLTRDAFRGERFDVLVSCLASRTGAPDDAWKIDHAAHVAALAAAQAAGVTQMVLLSAICVQKPLLAFQQAKLAFEQALIASGMTYSIVRPTAFFKSLSGQVERVRCGKPFLVFGDGGLTACKPISDRDLASYLVDCIADEGRHDRILPIGGPGEAITPRQQGEALFAALGVAPRFKHVPVKLLDTIIAVLAMAGRVSGVAKNKAELARIGRYYATESMLLWCPFGVVYDAESTPSTGTDTLFEHYQQLIAGTAQVDLGDHAVF